MYISEERIRILEKKIIVHRALMRPFRKPKTQLKYFFIQIVISAPTITR